MLPTVALVVLVFAIFGWLLDRALEAEVRNRASEEVSDHLDRTMESLRTVDGLSSAAVHAAMNVLLREAGHTGAASAQGKTSLNGQTVPDLRLGRTSQVENVALVDLVQQLTGATATLFVWKDSELLRVSTNVKKQDGSRAVGTHLDPTGQAYAALVERKAFYGVVEILGTPYMTGYEPMRNAAGVVVGAWYVGYPLTAVADLGRTIGDVKILDRGFITLLRPNGKILLKSSGMRESDVQSKIAGVNALGWTVVRRRFDPWGYTVLAAYPDADVRARVLPMRMLILACALVSCGLVLVTQYFLIARLVLRPINLLVGRMEHADLNTSLGEDRQDEIGVLRRVFDSFVTSIREALLEVAAASEDLVSTTRRLSDGTRDVATSVSTQKEQVAEIVVVLHDMSARVRAVSDHCGKTAATADNAASTARSGGALVEGSLHHIREIAQSVGNASARMDELAVGSDRIGKIVEVINEIAGQTSLLALNAAIEAARAGEHGRGFAVLATEVRRLAEKTARATNEIATMIESVQVGTRAAVECIQSGYDDVTVGVDVTTQAGAALNQIVGDAEKVGGMAAQIATAATQQAAATEQVYDSIEQINRVAGDSAESAKKSAAACEELSSLAVKLRMLVGRFQLESAAG